ncbi:MAG: methyltransferase type 12 [Proteobacteria bacterium]|nr:methyltransferase type 12 [Pseudomonadota bacterium]MBS0572692.1 methyltransferase type 12 [Pseudomonadota bacterium]
MATDHALFFRRLLKNPRQVSAIAPSSARLARAMTEGLGPATGRVVEFGPGTGSLTRSILARGVRPADLTLFELDESFAAALRGQFAGVTVHARPADRAPEFTEAGVGAVVSGLPLLSMPPAVSAAIVRAAFAILAPGAPLIQFTYGPKPSVPAATIAELGLRVEERAFVWLNLPPARVHHFTRP